MYKNNTVQAFCCFFYDKVIFVEDITKQGESLFYYYFCLRILEV